MSKRWPRFLLAFGLVALCVPQIASAQPTTRDHRNQSPTSAPPAEKAETITAKKGFVWVGGSWEWRNGQWEWIGGHFERAKRGKRWRAHKWESKGGVWVRIDGGWDVAEDLPDSPPPPPEKDNQANRDNWKEGHLWVSGYWDWKNYQWTWVKGRWERLQANKKLVPGHWEDKGGRWTWVADAWVDVGGPTSAPPPPRDEVAKTRAGSVWVAGHWEWLNGEYRWRKGHFEKVKPQFEWVAGHWDQKGNAWVWVEGQWKEVVVATTPTTAPPPPKVEKIGRRKNMIWVLGYYQWKNGQYVWVPGHWEKVQPKKRWLDGRWEQKNNTWVWIDGSWADGIPDWTFDNTGWTLLGSADVFGRQDTDVIKVGKYKGRFDQVTMVVTDSDLQLDDFVITFGNGETFAPKVKHTFKEGARSRAIDLPGNDRFIKSIELKYSNLPGGGRAHVDIYGRAVANKPATTTGSTVTGSTTVTVGGSTTTSGTVTTGGSTTVTTSGGGSVSVNTGGGGVSVTVTGPTEAPPALRAEKIGVKKGFIWVNGRWDWRGGKWEWIGGHWERARGGKTWADGRWEKKGNVYVWVEGGWR